MFDIYKKSSFLFTMDNASPLTTPPPLLSTDVEVKPKFPNSIAIISDASHGCELCYLPQLLNIKYIPVAITMQIEVMVT